MTKNLNFKRIIAWCLALFLVTVSVICIPRPAQSLTSIPTTILSSNANLSDLWLSSGALSPTFASGTTSYTSTSSGSTVQVRPYAAESNATITVNGKPVANGQWSDVAPLNPGPNMITVKVTAPDLANTKTYSIIVTKPAANDTNLRSLKISVGSLSPSFTSSNVSYKAIEDNSTSSIKIVAQAENDFAVITINRHTSTSSTYEQVVPLNVGLNAFSIAVTSQDRTTTKSYNITVTRKNTSTAASFGITVPSSTTTKNTLNFTVKALDANKNTVSDYTGIMHFTSSDASADLPSDCTLYNGVGYFSAILGTVGRQTLTATDTIFTAITGTSPSIKVVPNQQQSSSDYFLSGLELNTGNIIPTFDKGITDYTNIVDNSVTFVQICPNAEEPNAQISINGEAVTSGQFSTRLPLNVGDNRFKIQVIAQNGVATRTYIVTVTRTGDMQQLSNNANLSSLRLSTGEISPSFAPATADYTQSLDNTIGEVKLTATAEDSQASVTVNGIAVASGATSRVISLAGGENKIIVQVTAHDSKTIKTYTINVTRSSSENSQGVPTAPSGLNAMLSGTKIDLSWMDNSNSEDGFIVERKPAGGTYSQVSTVGANVTSATDSGLSPQVSYYYRVRAFNSSGNSSDSNEALPTTATTQTVMRFDIGKSDYYVNDQTQTMDAPPIIIEGRTLLPIRYVAIPLGVSVDWNEYQQKVTVSLKDKTIELWIGQGTAKVNGVSTPIDPDNPNVVPIVVPPGRTMLPLRFIAQNLGYQVDWNDSTQEVKVTYSQP